MKKLNRLNKFKTIAGKYTRNRTLWGKKEIELLAKYYPQRGKYFVSRILGRSPQAVAVKASRLDLRYPRHSYSFDENYFKRLKPKKAYFLGILAADGHTVCENGRYQVTLTLKPDDREILELFKKELKAEQPIKIYRNKRGFTIAIFRIYSKRFTTSIVRHGIIPKKSLRLLYPRLPKSEEYHRCFIRGYSDGDGCVCRTYQLGRRWSLVGNKEFLETVFYFIQKFSGAKGKICAHKGEHQNYKQLIYSGKNASKALKWLYEGKIKIWLNRKRRKWLEWDNLAPFNRCSKAKASCGLRAPMI